jgi:glutathione synthase/RimK-type ligase-like ATP-grasp enzyme
MRSRSNNPEGALIGIHDSAGSYSDRWIEWCQEHHVPFRRLNLLASDAVAQCEGLSGVLWHWTLVSLEEMLVARQVLAALESRGVLVFPNSATCWHYDDKVGQKYLLEAIGAPLIPSWVFTDPAEARRWIASTTWPKVFKLRCGAGSSNVRLVRSRAEAEDLCRQAFGPGFPAKPGYLNDARTKLRNTEGWREFLAKLKRAPESIRSILRYRRSAPRQRGYLLFQEFLAGNDFDTRVTLIGNRAFGAMRRNRPNDFRASGSGEAIFDPKQVDRRCVNVAFQVADKLGTQCLAVDFLFDANHEPRICEMSYCSVASPVYDCPGYWDRDLRWHEGHFWPQDLVVEDLLAALEVRNARNGQAVEVGA